MELKMSENLRTIPDSVYEFKNTASEKQHLIDVFNYDFGVNWNVENVTFSNPTALEEDHEVDLIKGGLGLPNINEKLKPNTEVMLTFDSSVRGLLYKRIRYHRNNLANQFFLIYGNKRPTDLPQLNWSHDNLVDEYSHNVKEWVVKMIPCRTTSIGDVLFDKENKAITIRANPLSLLFTGEVTIYLEDNSKTKTGWIAHYGADPL